MEFANTALMVATSGLGVFVLVVLASILVNGCGDARLNLSRLTGFFHVAVVILVMPFAAALASRVFQHLGFGFIALPIHSWSVIPGFIIYWMASDFLVYALHRAQHKIPALWAMHSLHHAETRVTMVTAYVNFWGEIVMEAAFVYPLIFVLFKVPPVYIYAASWIGRVHPLFVHADIRVPFGPLGHFFVSPQFHRLHHSSDPSHFNSNFAGTFSFWDWLFGTLKMPRRDHVLTTGLTPPEVPENGVSTLWWPLRKFFKQPFAAPSPPGQ